MAVVKINAIEVPPGGGAELEKRFAARAGAVENSPGFLGFELLRPVAGETRYFVYTRWESEEASRRGPPARRAPPTPPPPARSHVPRSPPAPACWSSRWPCTSPSPSHLPAGNGPV